MVVEVGADMLAPADKVWAEVKRTLDRRGVRPERVNDRDTWLDVREGAVVRTVSVEQTLGPRSRCTERIDVGGGIAAPLRWLGAHATVRKRLAALQRTARTL